MKTTTYSLTDIDASGWDTLPVTVGFFLVCPVDPYTVETALARVTEKWRLLAGRCEWDVETSRFAIRVPSGLIPPEYARYTFLATKSPGDAPYEIPTFLASSVEIVTGSPLDTLRVPGAPLTTREIARAGTPLISLRVSTYANGQFVSLSAPHGIFDGVGIGMILNAIDAELTGRSWAPPPTAHGNALAKRLKEIRKESALAPLHRPDWTLRRLSCGSGHKFWHLARLGWSVVTENAWFKCTQKEIFIGRDVFEPVVREVKAEVVAASRGAEWVSTGDVLLAWTQKALFSAEKENHAPLTTLSLWDVRSFVATNTNPMDAYPHNAISLYLLPPVLVSSLHSTPLSTLALASRRALNDSRTLPAFQEALDWTQSTLPVPARKCGTEGIYFTNQISARLTATSWGAPPDAVRGWWMRTLPKVDHAVFLNELPTGWIITACTRPSRWKSVAVELDKLRAMYTQSTSTGKRLPTETLV